MNEKGKMKPKALVIDDEENLRFTFDRFLTAESYEVWTAKDYDEAIKHLKGTFFDIIFSDILLGRETGIDVLRYVKERGMLTPVIMITGAPDIETASEAVRLGAFDYIPKPVRQDTVIMAAKMALRQTILTKERNRYRLNLEAIFRSMEDGIISVDKEMNVVEINNAAHNICKYSRDDGIGKRLGSIGLTCDKKCLTALMETIETKRPVEIDRLECQKRNRPAQVVTLRTSPLIDETGNFSGAIMIVRDETRLVQLEKDLEERHQFHKIIGKSNEIRKIFSLIEDLSDVDTTVLITGDSGTGKELVADALHYGGCRRKKPFIKVNCSALSENLLESELFGHVKGAFTGAVKDKFGRFEKADGGSIFLDEIGDISPRMQLRLLRVVQEMEFERVGDSTPIKVDVRVIAATNQDLRAKVKTGQFREDLYYRLKVVELKIPPLGERREDTPLLIDHFINKFNKKFAKHVSSVADDVIKMFLNYPWPGNVRELEHSLEHSFILCHSNTITVEDIPPDIANYMKMAAPLEETVEEDEQRYIIQALEKCGWNKAKAARILGIGRATMYRKLERYKIAPDKPR